MHSRQNNQDLLLKKKEKSQNSEPKNPVKSKVPAATRDRDRQTDRAAQTQIMGWESNRKVGWSFYQPLTLTAEGRRHWAGRGSRESMVETCHRWSTTSDRRLQYWYYHKALEVTRLTVSQSQSGFLESRSSLLTQSLVVRHLPSVTKAWCNVQLSFLSLQHRRKTFR